MSTAQTPPLDPAAICAEIQEQTLRACRVARGAAGIVAEGIATGVASVLDGVREREKELDTLDREIDDRVTSVITQAGPEHARELLACLKFIIDLERIGDLLLNCSNRAAAVGSRIDLQDIRELTVMASRLEKMLGDVHDAFAERDLNRALGVLRSDAELDRLAGEASEAWAADDLLDDPYASSAYRQLLARVLVKRIAARLGGSTA